MVDSIETKDIRITIGMIVLNGEPFVRYNLRSLYPYAHQIIVVEGACPAARNIAGADGHSLDTTLDTLRHFKADEDPDNKLIVVTAEDEGYADGFWRGEKDEMSQAYARRATGNYLWQVDSDEFYKDDDINAVIAMLRDNPSISSVIFPMINFWGGPDYYADGIAQKKGYREFRRLFAWGKGYSYASHRPPTILDNLGHDVCTTNPKTSIDMERMNILLYHYSLVLPQQVDEKLLYYGARSPEVRKQRENWHKNYYSLENPFGVDIQSVYGEPSWLSRFHGDHPQQAKLMWDDLRSGALDVRLRQTDDIERLLSSRKYAVAKTVIPAFWSMSQPINGILQKMRAGRIKQAIIRRMPGRLRKPLDNISYLPSHTSNWYRLKLLEWKFTSKWAMNRWLIESVPQNPEARLSALSAQFSEWHDSEIAPKLAYYSGDNWASISFDSNSDSLKTSCDNSLKKPGLFFAGKDFFEAYNQETGQETLLNAAQAMQSGAYLMVYAPSKFAYDRRGLFKWIPDWKYLYGMFDINSFKVVDFNPGFDRNGFFHFLIQKKHIQIHNDTQINDSKKLESADFFHLKAGTSRLHSHSSKVLSAMGFRLLQGLVKKCRFHEFSSNLPEHGVGRGSIAMGHYGPWIPDARRSGALTVIMGPGIRFRDDHDCFARDPNVSFRDQFLACHTVITHAGGSWRTIDPWKYSGLCRWIDLPVNPAVFPWSKKVMNKSGRRIFAFVNLYNERQKGLETARRICEECSEIEFITIGCPDFGLINCKAYPRVESFSSQYRKIITQADFVISPARDDCQPGPPAECASLGLLPIVSEYAGYVLSFPKRINVDDISQCAEVIRYANSASNDEIREWQALMAEYIKQFHRPGVCEELLKFYIDESIYEYTNDKSW